MSATNRGAERIEGDRYMTPAPLAKFLVESVLLDDGWLSRDRPYRILEPHAGKGAFVRAIRRAMPAAHITANDSVDAVGRWFERGADDARVGDFLRMDGYFDAAIGNPPYSTAEAQVRHSIKLTPKDGGIVAFLLRLGFLESKDRIKFWKRYRPAAVYALSERPSFNDGGTDQTAYGFFIWKRGWVEHTRLHVVSWKTAT